jgi:hypothetical protein
MNKFLLFFAVFIAAGAPSAHAQSQSITVTTNNSSSAWNALELDPLTKVFTANSTNGSIGSVTAIHALQQTFTVSEAFAAASFHIRYRRGGNLALSVFEVADANQPNPLTLGRLVFSNDFTLPNVDTNTTFANLALETPLDLTAGAYAFQISTEASPTFEWRRTTDAATNAEGAVFPGNTYPGGRAYAVNPFSGAGTNFADGSSEFSLAVVAAPEPPEPPVIAQFAVTTNNSTTQWNALELDPLTKVFTANSTAGSIGSVTATNSLQQTFTVSEAFFAKSFHIRYRQGGTLGIGIYRVADANQANPLTLGNPVLLATNVALPIVGTNTTFAILALGTPLALPTGAYAFQISTIDSPTFEWRRTSNAGTNAEGVYPGNTYPGGRAYAVEGTTSGSIFNFNKGSSEFSFAVVADSEPPTDDYTVWALGYPGADLANQEGDYDSDGFINVAEYAFGTDPTVGNASLTTATAVSNNLLVSFFQRSGSTNTVPSYVAFATTDLTIPFAPSGATITPLTNTAPAGYQAALFTQPVVGSKIFYRIEATLPQGN